MLFSFWNRYSELNRSLFVEPNAPIGDNLLLPFIRLREEAARRDITVEALDAHSSPAAIVFLDHPGEALLRWCDEFRPKVPRFLVHFENETVVPENFDPVQLSRFRKVFTWDTRLLGASEQFVRLNYAQDLPPASPLVTGRQHCCIIAGRKSCAHPRSLYFEREETIRAALSIELHVYGPGWERLRPQQWRGVIVPGLKRSTLAKYEFSICYENAKDIPGYITEKIFDCFAAGTIPVYWGAPDVTDSIPPECFINRRSFASNRALFDHLRGLTRDEKRGYRAMIDSFLGSEEVKPFTIETWVETVLSTLVQETTR